MTVVEVFGFHAGLVTQSPSGCWDTNGSHGRYCNNTSAAAVLSWRELQSGVSRTERGRESAAAHSCTSVAVAVQNSPAIHRVTRQHQHRRERASCWADLRLCLLQKASCRTRTCCCSTAAPGRSACGQSRSQPSQRSPGNQQTASPPSCRGGTQTLRRTERTPAAGDVPGIHTRARTHARCSGLYQLGSSSPVISVIFCLG